MPKQLKVLHIHTLKARRVDRREHEWQEQLLTRAQRFDGASAYIVRVKKKKRPLESVGLFESHSLEGGRARASWFPWKTVPE